MADPVTPLEGAAPPPSAPAPEIPRLTIRQAAEKAYDSLVDAPDVASEGSEDTGDGQSSRPRDNLGRFVASDRDEPGEAAGTEPTQPREEIQAQPEADAPAQPPPGRSSEAPANWSQPDREMFSKAPPDMQEWALRRHREMEGEFHRRVQATAQAAQMVDAVAPVFRDPVIAASLQQHNLTEVDAIGQWAGFHRRFVDPNPQVRASVLQELMQRSGLDPAAVFATQRPQAIPGLSPKDQADPAIKYITDTIGRMNAAVQAQENKLAQIQQHAAQQVFDEQKRLALGNIEQFANEKDARGNLRHPDFDEVAPLIYKAFEINPGYTMQEAYELACSAHPGVRQKLIQAEVAAARQQEANARAKQAVRSNTRGITSPVTSGARPNGPVGLRAAIEAAAEEVGL
jgi:hypothetical protein